MDQATVELQSILPGEEDMGELQATIKQEKEVFIGDTELQQMQMREWCPSDGDKTDRALYHTLKLENQWQCNAKISYYNILHDISKTECLECGKLLSGTRKANIKRHYKLVHKKDIKIGRERRSSDDEYADQSSLNYTQRESYQDNVNNENELMLPETDENLKQGNFQCIVGKGDIKALNQSDGKTQRESNQDNVVDNPYVNLNQTEIENELTDEKQDNKALNQSDDKANNTSGKYSSYINYYFTFLKDVKKTECLQCGKFLSGTSKSNIVRHYRLVHKKIIDNGRDASSSSDDDYAEPPSKRHKPYKSFGINIDESKFLKCCVGLVAVKNIPLRIFEDRDFFKTLISPYEKKFGTDLNSSNVVSLLETSVAKIQNRIAKRVKNKMVSLKIDIATRRNKGIIGINIQYLKDFKLCYNTLGVLQLDKVQQESTLKDEILKYLGSYEIDTCQVYSITTDNGANVVKASEILQEFQDEYVFDDLSQPKGHAVEDHTHDDNIDGRTYEESIHSALASVMQAISCVAHTIQMAAYDVLKLLQLELTQCRDVVKTLQTSAPANGGEIQMPVLDNATSWYSTYIMLKSLLNIKEYVCTTYSTDWDFVTGFVSAFEPLAKCTEQLQNDQYIAGDFYRDWFSCELELEDLFATTSHAKLLHAAMQDKKNLLFQNVDFISALFLDPRFNFMNSTMLSEEQKNKAVEHLAKTFEMIQKLENTATPQTLSEQPESMPEDPSVNIDTFNTDETTASARAYAKMAKHIASLVARTTKSSETQRTIKQKLISLSDCKMVPIHTDILQYFKYTVVDADISKIIDVVLAVPANQISVERTYSGLAVTLTKPNATLTNTLLDNLMLTKLNIRELTSKHVQLENAEV